MRLILPVLAAVILLSGCILQPEPKFTCPNGDTVTNYDDCPKPTFETDEPGLANAIVKCDKSGEGELKDACYTDAAMAYSDLKTCDKIGDRWWKWFCYQKLGGEWIWGPVETTTTRLTTTTVTSTSTTTTTLCGNGRIDSGEECDMGSVCAGTQGVCGIANTKPIMASCLVDGACNWNTQVMASGPYDMGSCNGCFSVGGETPCECMRVNMLNRTVAPLPAGSGVTPVTTLAEYHSVCQDGLCSRVGGAGDNECSTSDECRHYECMTVSGKGRCGLVRSSGTSTCAADSECS